MTDILLLIPQGAYDGKVTKAEECINRHKENSSGEIEFVYTIGLIKRQSTPQWSEGIRSYSAAITKNKYKLTKMEFTTDYSVLVHNLKFHLENFPLNPQGTSFTKLIDEWDKKYGYGYRFTKIHFNQLITNIIISNDKWRQSPGYNKSNDIIYVRKT